MIEQLAPPHTHLPPGQLNQLSVSHIPKQLKGWGRVLSGSPRNGMAHDKDFRVLLVNWPNWHGGLVPLCGTERHLQDCRQG